MIIRALLLSLILCATTGYGQVRMPATTRVGLAELQAMAAKEPAAEKLTMATQGYYPTAFVHGRCMVGFLAKVDDTFTQARDREGVTWGSRKGDILSLRIDAHDLSIVEDLEGIAYLELAGKAAPDLQYVPWAIHADSVYEGIGLPQSYTGRDVLIGITDWGFDYTHPMFYDTAMADYRVRAAWDQYRQAGPAPPGFGYGTELTTQAELLAVQADTANIYSYATHGSHVAGIAAGGGAGTIHRGIAFDAHYLFCTFLVDAAAVLDAFAWMQAIAEQDDKRLVINMSWGLHHIGTLDGNSLISQAIDQLAAEGVVFVNSGGNNGDVNFHIRKDFIGDTLRSRIQFYPYSANVNMWGQSISMWGEEGSSFSAGLIVTNNANQVQLESPWYNTATQPAYLDSFLVVGPDTVHFNLTAESAHPLNGRSHFRLRASNRSTQLKVALKATAPSGRVHFWNVTELTNDVGNWGQEFQAAQSSWTIGNKQYGIGEPACTESLISVAAYSTEYLTPGGNTSGGAVASFSSYGPTLDERNKPDIAAPGVSVGSSISSFTDDTYTAFQTVEFQGRDYPFARFSGTSMSAPVVAGVVALMLEADPTLTPAEVKEVIRITARTDGHTGAIPPGGSTRWGFGKVNAYRAVKEVLGLNSVGEYNEDAVLIWPNPASDELNVLSTIGRGPARVIISDITGRAIHDRIVANGGPITVSISGWSKGMYHVQVVQGSLTTTGKVVKQ